MSAPAANARSDPVDRVVAFQLVGDGNVVTDIHQAFNQLAIKAERLVDFGLRLHVFACRQQRFIEPGGFLVAELGADVALDRARVGVPHLLLQGAARGARYHLGAVGPVAARKYLHSAIVAELVADGTLVEQIFLQVVLAGAKLKEEWRLAAVRPQAGIHSEIVKTQALCHLLKHRCQPRKRLATEGTHKGQIGRAHV